MAEFLPPLKCYPLFRLSNSKILGGRARRHEASGPRHKHPIELHDLWKNKGCLVTMGVLVDGRVGQVITAEREEWIGPPPRLSVRRFHKLVRMVAERGGLKIADGRPGIRGRCRWSIECCWSRCTGHQPDLAAGQAAVRDLPYRRAPSGGPPPLLTLQPIRHCRRWQAGPEKVDVVDGSLVLSHRADHHQRRHPPGRRGR